MKSLFANALQKAINCYLALDPESKQHLQALDGKVVTIHLLGMNFIFQLIFVEGKVQLQMGESLKANTVIKGTPLRLLQMAFSEDRKSFFADDVSIQGNLDLAQQVIDLFDHLEIDWEEKASDWIGDVPAHQLGRIGLKLKAWSKKTRQIIMQNVNEYVHEEVDVFPPKEALTDFFQDVDILRMDVDRLEVKARQIQEKIVNKIAAKRSGM